MTAGDAIPVNVLTGFLGSGKTTYLQRVLSDPAFADTAVLVNEFGEVGLDHHLLKRVEGDVVLLKSGCICCTVREDLGTAIRDLHGQRGPGAVPAFRRLVIETTGLADPVPILSTVLADPVIRHHYRLGNVVTTVDAVNGAFHLDRQPESVRQAAVADRLILTKTDIADPDAAARLRRRLGALNPAAPIVEAADPAGDPAAAFSSDPYDPATRNAEVRRWLADAAAGEDDRDHHHGHRHGPIDRSRHGDDIGSFCLTFDRPVDWTLFGIWLSMLLHARGEDILRVKGLLDVPGVPAPVVINGVQRVVHPPLHLDAWPDADRRSRIVFITRGIGRAEVEASLAAFLALDA